MQAAADDDADLLVAQPGAREPLEHGRQQRGYRTVAGGVGDHDGYGAGVDGQLRERRRAEGCVERRGDGARQIGEVGEAGGLLELAGALDRQAAPARQHVGLHVGVSVSVCRSGGQTKKSTRAATAPSGG